MVGCTHLSVLSLLPRLLWGSHFGEFLECATRKLESDIKRVLEWREGGEVIYRWHIFFRIFAQAAEMWRGSLGGGFKFKVELKHINRIGITPKLAFESNDKFIV